MWITELQVDNFGGLRDLSLEFDTGFNLIHGENETGKSTLMSFIRAMFYGMTGNARSIAENERKHWLPWGQDKMGGWLNFTHNNCLYRIERSFGKTKRLDTVNLRDNLTGELISVPGKNEIGEWLFGVAEAEFINTVFIRQLASAEVFAEDNTQAKLANLASTGDERVSGSEIDSRLRRAMVFYKAEKGNGGYIPELQRRREELLNERRDVLELEANRSDLLQTYQYAEQTRTSFEQALAAGRDLLVRCREHEESEIQEVEAGRRRELQQLENTAAEMRNSLRLDDKFCGWDELNDLYARRNRISEGKAGIAVMRARGEQQAAELSSVRERKAEIAAAVRGSSGNLRTAMIGLVLIILGIAGGWQLTPVLYIIALAGLLILGYNFQKTKNNESKLQLAALEAKETELLAVINHHAAGLREAEAEQKRLEQELRQDLFTLENLPLNTSADSGLRSDDDRLAAIRRRLTELDLLETVIRERQNNLAGNEPSLSQAPKPADSGSTSSLLAELQDFFSSLVQAELLENDLLEDDRLSTATLQAGERPAANSNSINDCCQHLSAVLTVLQERSGTAAIEAAGLESELRHRFGDLRNLEDIDDELRLTDKQLRTANNEYAALALARTGYDSAFRELQQSFGPRLNRRGGEVLAQLTGGRHREMRVDRELQISLPDPDTGELHEYDYLSGGTIDQAYLALRLAVAELISSPGERLPLLLDDVLIQYDDTRAAAGLDFLAKYAAEQNVQLLLFTCQRRLLNQAGVNLIELGT